MLFWALVVLAATRATLSAALGGNVGLQATLQVCLYSGRLYQRRIPFSLHLLVHIGCHSLRCPRASTKAASVSSRPIVGVHVRRMCCKPQHRAATSAPLGGRQTCSASSRVQAPLFARTLRQCHRPCAAAPLLVCTNMNSVQQLGPSCAWAAVILGLCCDAYSLFGQSQRH